MKLNTASVGFSCAVAIAALVVSTNSHAITLPDTGSCASGSQNCLSIQKTNVDNSAAIFASGPVFALTASSPGIALKGTTSSGWAVSAIATAPNGGGVYVSANPSGGSAIVADCPGGTAAWFNGNAYMNGALISTSDARLKKEIRDLSYGLSDMLKLRPVSFQWKSDAEAKTHLGLIAQEVEKIVPELVTHAHDPKGAEVLSVNYIELVPILMKSIQEQDARIKLLEKERTHLSSILGGGALAGLVPLGLVFGLRRRKTQPQAD